MWNPHGVPPQWMSPSFSWLGGLELDLFELLFELQWLKWSSGRLAMARFSDVFEDDCHSANWHLEEGLSEAERKRLIPGARTRVLFESSSSPFDTRPHLKCCALAYAQEPDLRS